MSYPLLYMTMKPNEKNQLRFPLLHKVLALVLIPLIVSSALLVYLSFLLQQSEAEAERESHARQVRNEGSIISAYAEDWVSSLVNMALTNDKDYLRVADDCQLHTKKELARFQSLFTDQAQLDSVKTIGFLLDRISQSHSSAKKQPRLNDDELKELWQTADQIKIEIRKLNIYEARNSNGLDDSQRRFLIEIKQALGFGAVLNLTIALGLCIFAVKELVSRLLLLKENCKRLAKREYLLPIAKGSDEIAEIDSGFHDMATALDEYVRKEQAMFENANDIICSLDAELRFLRINKACLPILGFSSEHLVNRKVIDFFAEESKDKSTAQVSAAINLKGDSEFETVMKCADQSLRVLLWTAHWVEQDQALFCVLHDITELKRIERMKQDFVAMVSHDLRSPLMAVQATFEMLEDNIYGELSAPGHAAVVGSQRSLYFLLQFVEQILDAEKMESGRFELERRENEIQPVLDRTQELIRDLAQQRDVKLDICTTNAEAYFDSDRIVQVLLNLISNAIKYAPPESIVSVSITASEEEALFEIADHGQGIPESMHQIIFDRFQQVQSSDWKQKKGSGLGLAICKMIVESHGGSIGVRSEVGKGSTFWFTVPKHKTNANKEGQSNRSS